MIVKREQHPNAGILGSMVLKTSHFEPIGHSKFIQELVFKNQDHFILSISYLLSVIYIMPASKEYGSMNFHRLDKNLASR